MSFSLKEYHLLLELQQDPLISYKKLAEKLNVSSTTITNLVQKLNENDSRENIIRGKRTPFGLYAIYNYHKLGLTRVTFLFECKNNRQMDQIRKICDLHPYTYYQARIYGGINGIFVIFTIPIQIIKHLYDFFDILVSRNTIERYEVVVEQPEIYINNLPDLTKFNVQTIEWDFNISDFALKVDSKPNFISKSLISSSKNNTILNRLNLFDFGILREWMIGAGPRKLKSEIIENLKSDQLYTGIKESYNLSRSFLDERYDFLHPKGKQNLGLINSYGIRYDRTKLNLQNEVLITGMANVKFLFQLTNALYIHEFPFNTSFSMSIPDKSNNSSFYWWLSLPPRTLSEISGWLLEKTQILKIHVASTNSEHLVLYPLYHENFMPNPNGSGGIWKTDYEYCVSEPLNGLLK